MIAVDYSQIMIAAMLAQGSDFEKGADVKKMEQIARHVILNSLLKLKRDNGDRYGEMVICCDGSNNWRKGVFPYYKAHRANSRKESTTDWASVFSIGDTIRSELMETFPYKVVRVDRAEADDCVGVLCKYTQDNDLNTEGLEETPQRFLAVSSDGDYKQLYKYKNYTQWSPIQKKIVARPLKTFLVEKIIDGDKGDGIPNLKSADDSIVNGVRQTPIRQKFVDEVLANGLSVLTEQERRNYDRNKLLIDIQEEIISTYKASTPVFDKNAIFEYCVKHRLRQLTAEIQNF
jgi:hypothetical protein